MSAPRADPSAKASLRAEMRVRLASYRAQDLADWSQTITEILIGVDWLRSAQTIAAFSPLRCEPDISPLITLLSIPRWCLPRVRGNCLEFACVSGNSDELLRSDLGVLEPGATATVVEAADIHVALVPGLAFDRSGGRLGRGRGFYDRWLATLPATAFIVGVAFDCQIVENVPCDLFDARVFGIVSQSGFATVL